MANVPKLNLEPNKPVTVTFVYDNPVEGDGQYGHYWIYRFQMGDQQYSWFAPYQEIHNEIQNAGYKQGDKITIEKKVYNDGKKDRVKYLINKGTVEASPEPQNAPVSDLKQDSEEKPELDAKDLRIAKLSCISSASDIVSAEINATNIDISEDQVIKYAEKFLDWVYKK